MKKYLFMLIGSILSLIILIGCGEGNGSSNEKTEYILVPMSKNEKRAVSKYKIDSKNLNNLKNKIITYPNTNIISESRVSLNLNINDRQHAFFDMNYIDAWVDSFTTQNISLNINSFVYNKKNSNNIKKAIILRPFEFQIHDGSNPESFLANAGYQVKILENTDVTIDILSRIGNYDVVYLITHGLPNGDFCTSIIIEDGYTVGNNKNLFDCHISDRTYIGIKSSFFSNKFTDDFINTIVFTNSCELLKTSKLSNILIDRGASIVTGWDIPLMETWSNWATDKLFENISKFNTTIYDGIQNTKILNANNFIKCDANDASDPNIHKISECKNYASAFDVLSHYVVYGNKKTVKLNNSKNTSSNQSPVAKAGNNQTVTEGDRVYFDASKSSDDNGIINYLWIDSSNFETLYDGTSSSFSISNLSVGTHIISLQVKDAQGETAFDTVTITVDKSLTYSWSTGSWGNCIGECGINRGVKSRTVTCKSSNNTTVSDSYCSGTKPSTSQSCTASTCVKTAVSKITNISQLNEEIKIYIELTDNDNDNINYMSLAVKQANGNSVATESIRLTQNYGKWTGTYSFDCSDKKFIPENGNYSFFVVGYSNNEWGEWSDKVSFYVACQHESYDSAPTVNVDKAQFGYDNYGSIRYLQIDYTAQDSDADNIDYIEVSITNPDGYNKTQRLSLGGGNNGYISAGILADCKGEDSDIFTKNGTYAIKIRVQANAKWSSWDSGNVNVSCFSSSPSSEIPKSYYSGNKTYSDGKDYSISVDLVNNQYCVWVEGQKGCSRLYITSIYSNKIQFYTYPYFNSSCKHSFNGEYSYGDISGSFSNPSCADTSNGTWYVSK